MDAIRRAEERAAETVREARKEAERIIEAAKTEGTARRRAAEKWAVDLLGKTEREAADAAEKETAKTAEESVRMKADIRETAEKKREEAVKMVISELN